MTKIRINDKIIENKGYSIMTVGKRISKLRKNLKLTQDDLAKIINVHIGSIKKYEADKMKPKKEHLEKIASVLNVRPYVLLENNYEFILETYGDLYGLFITLNKMEFISFSLCNTDVVKLQFNPVLKQILNITNQSQMIEWENFNITVTDKLREHDNYPVFIQWVERCNSLNNFINSLSNPNNPAAINVIHELKEQIETFELKLQQSTELL